MNILITGSTGALGRAAIPLLSAAGHDVRGVARDAAGRQWLRAVGARPVDVDLFDPNSARIAMSGIDVVVHLASAIPKLRAATKKSSWVENDRLRSTATRTLVDAALDASVGRFVQASITFNYTDGGAEWIDEQHDVKPLVPATASALTAERHVDRFAAIGGAGVVLRFSNLYGPDKVSADLVTMLRHRRIPVVGAGTNYVSNVHVDDAGSAIATALNLPSGRYNVTDDEPITAGERLRLQASAVGALDPRHVPVALARLVAGRSVRLLTVSQRVSNRRLSDESGWLPRHPTIRSGWATVASPDLPPSAVQPREHVDENRSARHPVPG